MSKTNNFEDHWLQLVFQNIASGTHVANIGSGLLAAVTPGNMEISLHVADPGEAPATEQTTNETTYSGYARESVVRSAAGWLVSSGTADNVAAIAFTTVGATGATLTHFGVGTANAGNGQLLYTGTITPNLVASTGVTPTFSIGDCNVAED